VARQPIGAAEAMALASRFGVLYVKIGNEMFRWDRGQAEISEADLKQAFVHEDGQLRIPVLIVGDVIIRGFHEPSYAVLLTK
jgi:hypothetical protein